MTQIDIAKLTALIPELESWTGGERRDLDAKIAEACGWKLSENRFGWLSPSDNCVHALPSYLGTDPSIATEDMQRLVRESGFVWGRQGMGGELFWWVSDSPEPTDGAYADISLPLAWARAIVVEGEHK